MAYPTYLRERARELRTAKHLSLDEIAERLALNKSTVWYWIKDLPLGRPRRASTSQEKGNHAMQNMWRQRRETAYAEGLAKYDELVEYPTFRDFVALYIAEGDKRCRNRASICNSDVCVVAVVLSWFRRLSTKPPKFALQYHADQDFDELRVFWGTALNIDGGVIRFQRKSNSGQLNGRTWRSEHGVLTVTVHDTLFRARLQAWIDRIRQDWDLH